MTEVSLSEVSPPNRQAQLDAIVANRVARGARVESTSGSVVVLVSGRNINHVLHVILTVMTLTAWFWLVYLWLLSWNGVLFGERRSSIRIDENRRIIEQKVRLFGLWKSANDVTPL